MTRIHFHFMVLPLVAAIGCGGSHKNPPTTADDMSVAAPAPDLSAPAPSPDLSPPPGNATLGTDGGYEGDGGLGITGSNVAPVIVDDGPSTLSSGSANVPFISVTVCVPGTSTCATVDHISVDTGSTGLRIIASALPADFTLPQATGSDTKPLTECFSFEDGFVFGSVRNADVKIGGESAANIPLELIGDPAYPKSSIPSNCTGTNEGTVDTFGGNGIIGINQWLADCGSDCASATAVANSYTFYYSCTGTTCAYIPVPIANQVPNPVSKFAVDNNGAILQFPDVSEAGGANLPGVLIFGIGTQTNNALGNANVIPVDQDTYFTTTYKGTTAQYSYIDSGTSLMYFSDASITACDPNGNDAGLFCPATVLNLSGQMAGVGGALPTSNFTVANADTVFQNDTFTAFNDVAGDSGDPTTFAWGFDFFLGRKVFTAFALPANNNGNGYFAY